MSDIDYDLLRSNSGGDPPDGVREAYLARAQLVETSGGTRLVTEWQSTNGGPAYYWVTWFGFEGNRIAFTQDFLDALGCDRSSITDDDQFEEALANVTGTVYSVRTSAWSGGVNTYVEETTTQTALPVADIPADTAGLPDAVPDEPVRVPDDDDIPF
jgi:hypothetical protein